MKDSSIVFFKQTQLMHSSLALHYLEFRSSQCWGAVLIPSPGAPLFSRIWQPGALLSNELVEESLSMG